MTSTSHSLSATPRIHPRQQKAFGPSGAKPPGHDWQTVRPPAKLATAAKHFRRHVRDVGYATDSVVAATVTITGPPDSPTITRRIHLGESLLIDAFLECGPLSAAPHMSPSAPADLVTSLDPGPVSRVDVAATSGGMSVARIGLLTIFAAIPLLLVSIGAGLVVMFLGASVFSLGNYLTYRHGDDGYMIAPATASRLFVGSLALALTSLVAALTN